MDNAVAVALKLATKTGQAFGVQPPARGGVLAGVGRKRFGHMIAFLLRGPDAPILHIGPV